MLINMEIVVTMVCLDRVGHGKIWTRSEMIL